MKRENNPMRLPLETWCSLTVLYNAQRPTKKTEALDACVHQCVLDLDHTRVNNIVIKPVIDNRK